jgi:hypothetical protein
MDQAEKLLTELNAIERWNAAWRNHHPDIQICAKGYIRRGKLSEILSNLLHILPLVRNQKKRLRIVTKSTRTNPKEKSPGA